MLGCAQRGFDVSSMPVSKGQDQVPLGDVVMPAVELLAAIVESSDDAIIAMTLDGTIVSWNRAAEDLYGYTGPEAVGAHLTLIVPDDRRDELDEIMSAIRAGERVAHLETVRVHRDGHHIDVSLTVSAICGASGTVIGASAIARDVTERKHFDAALSAYADTLEQTCAVLEQAERLCRMGTWIIHLDADEPWLYWSMNCYRLLGIDDTKTVDLERFFALVHPDDRQRLQDAMADAIAHHHSYEVVHRMICPDGMLRTIRAYAEPQYDQLGRPQRVLGVAQLITERDTPDT
jgi:PAS domain S-box-containing protein